MDVELILDEHLCERGTLTPGDMAELCRRHPRARARLLDFFATWWMLNAPPARVNKSPPR